MKKMHGIRTKSMVLLLVAVWLSPIFGQTADTIFEAASSSKVISAYLALKLVDQGRLALDEPLNSYLTDPWLPSSEYKEPGGPPGVGRRY